MFFSDRIVSIKSTDRVLEIGPGATPHFRSDIFLEKKYESEEELISQSGRVGLLQTDKPIILYDGTSFPFDDKEFDYVICSHVLEHVENADKFLGEIQRVGKKGYLEFPTIYYDFIYNIPEHNLLLFYEDGLIKWMTKEQSGLNNYSSIQELFFASLNLGYFDFVNHFKNYFFQGFEWFDEIKSYEENNINLLTFQKSQVSLAPLDQALSESIIDFSSISLRKVLKSKISKFFAL